MTLGWPLTQSRREAGEVKKTFVAADELADIFRVQLQIQPGVWMYGVLFLRHSENPLPLVISQHGGFGTPELCSSFIDSANYNDMTRRILQKGVHVFCPQLFLWHWQLFGEREYDRRAMDDQLKRVGSSITAIEIDGLQQYLDYLQTLPQVRPDRIGMIGLSYGGFHSILLTALDLRIKACMSSSFFNSTRAHTEFSDCAWKGSENVFQDAETAALVYPRKLWIAVGDHDELFPCQSAREEFARLQTIHGNWNDVHFQVFPGVHEFPKDDAGIEFVVQALRDV
jgi:dienelactone hydrolase